MRRSVWDIMYIPVAQRLYASCRREGRLSVPIPKTQPISLGASLARNFCDCQRRTSHKRGFRSRFSMIRHAGAPTVPEIARSVLGALSGHTSTNRSIHQI
jgi:hypothetical protein